MNHLIDMATSIEADVAKENLKELIAERADDILEQITGMTPGLSIVAKLGKIYGSVRDYHLIEKCVAFLTNLSSLSYDERKNLVYKINNDPIYGQKFGKFIVLAIDRLEYAEKAVYLARACKFYERADISKDLFIRIKGILEKIELCDLQALSYNDKHGYHGFPSRFNFPRLYQFQSLDLVIFEHTVADFKAYESSYISGNRLGTSRPSEPKLTNLGKIIIHIINDIPLNRWLKGVSDQNINSSI
ncbi:hypothetical protein [Mucilaginibacter sp. CSA2-8R]|uniref:hypothetical protein n=1 Tax=Mucilaginibacter sp. CSA2-8R TaxID=3141542 RepID=UPI00315DE1F8